MLAVLWPFGSPARFAYSVSRKLAEPVLSPAEGLRHGPPSIESVRP